MRTLYMRNKKKSPTRIFRYAWFVIEYLKPTQNTSYCVCMYACVYVCVTRCEGAKSLGKFLANPSHAFSTFLDLRRATSVTAIVVTPC